MVDNRRQYPRTARLNESLLHVLADELERMSDPRLELVTLTGVDVSRDLAHARVYYSTLALETTEHTDDLADNVAAGLAAATPHFRSAVGRQLRIRQVPALDFRVDPGIVAGQRVEEILRGDRRLADDEQEL
ncbi:MAG TPA: 30S ribosome-binding factor RbfA [Acidimicrobiia bacterium]|nr:30S ribosome-binding factor RbfA [Acidimicrobiia bacterium]